MPASIVGAAALAALCTWMLPPANEAGLGSRSVFIAAYLACWVGVPIHAAFAKLPRAAWLAVSVGGEVAALGFVVNYAVHPVAAAASLALLALAAMAFERSCHSRVEPKPSG